MAEQQTGERGQPYRMYTEHRSFVLTIGLPLLFAVVFYLGFAPSIHGPPSEFVSQMLPMLVLAAAVSPILGIVMLLKHGPLVIDPVAETLTYRRREIPFAKLGLVRITKRTTRVMTGTVDGLPASSQKIPLDVVVSGNFRLSPDDWLSKRRVVRLANRLNDDLAAYYRRIGEPRDLTAEDRSPNLSSSARRRRAAARPRTPRRETPGRGPTR